MQRNWDREREQVHHITDLIPMITEDHANPPPIVPVVSDNNSDDDYISAHQVSEGEPISGYGPTDRPIPPETHPQQSSEEPKREHSQKNLHREKLQDIPYGNVIKNRLIISNLHKMLYVLTCGLHQKPVHTKNLLKNVKGSSIKSGSINSLKGDILLQIK